MMVMITTVTCDGCGGDLSTTPCGADHRLTLQSERIPNDGGGVEFMFGTGPLIGRTHHFCRLSCLHYWSRRVQHADDLMDEVQRRWRAEFGVRDSQTDAMVVSEMPEHLQKQKEAQCMAEALDKFPLMRVRR